MRIARRRQRPQETPPPVGRVLFSGQSYYHAWYLSRGLRKLGWKADVLNWDDSEATAGFYHGEDFLLPNRQEALNHHVEFFASALDQYDIFHFSNRDGLCISPLLQSHLTAQTGIPGAELRILCSRGKKRV
jgi:hypothetical protein